MNYSRVQLRMDLGKCNSLLFCSALLTVLGGVVVGCIQIWLREKSYVFTAEEVASITTEAIHKAACKLVNSMAA